MHFETGLVSEAISFLKMFVFLSSFDWQDIYLAHWILHNQFEKYKSCIFTNQTIKNKQTIPVWLVLIGWCKFEFVVLELFVYLKNWKERNNTDQPLGELHIFGCKSLTWPTNRPTNRQKTKQCHLVSWFEAFNSRLCLTDMKWAYQNHIPTIYDTYS